MSNLIEELLALTRPFAEAPDHVQGGGGNASVKGEDGLMHVKASGYEFGDLTANNGIAHVRYAPVERFFAQAEDTPEAEKASAALVKAETLPDSPRPSMETGFHAALGRCVLHTHSVYANVLCCAEGSETLFEEFASKTEVHCAFVPYVAPGFPLSRLVWQINRKEKQPTAFLLQNHGVIVQGETPEECLSAYRELHERLSGFLGKTAPYPEPRLERIGENRFASRTEGIGERLLALRPFTAKALESEALFPDQTIFFAGNIHIGETPDETKKANIDPRDGSVTYRCSQREARTIEATLLACLYIREEIDRRGRKPRFLSEQDNAKLLGLESEKHRQAILRQADARREAEGKRG